MDCLSKEEKNDKHDFDHEAVDVVDGGDARENYMHHANVDVLENPYENNETLEPLKCLW